MRAFDAAAETERLRGMDVYERSCYERGAAFVAGVDEVGRGPLAGPVLACAVILPEGCLITGVNDSKKLSPKKREALSAVILEQALAVGFGYVSPGEIDRVNIRNATRLAMKTAVEHLEVEPDCVLVDGKDALDITCTQASIVAGDAKCHAIAAASIVAKVARDAMMAGYHERYPEYGFDRHKGYGTKVHIEAILRHGLCPIHRRSFVKRFITA